MKSDKVNQNKKIVKGTLISMNLNIPEHMTLKNVNVVISNYLESINREEYKFKNINSWEDIISYLNILLTIIKPDEFRNMKFNEKESYKNQYFKNPEAEIIYYLTQLDGEVQREKLKIESSHYKNKKLAQEWRNKMLKKIHPDRCEHRDASKAVDILNNIYEKMVK